MISLNCSDEKAHVLSTQPGTYGFNDASLKVLALESRQEEVGGIGGGGGASQQSDRVETHVGSSWWLTGIYIRKLVIIEVLE